MGKAPAFQLYVDDWLGSTRIALMSPAAVGGYIFLLCHAWSDPDCGLPDNDVKLAILSRLGENWQDECDSIMCCFEPHPTVKGKIHNVRLTAVWKERREYIERSSAAGKFANAVRWGKVSNPNRIRIEGKSDPSPSPSPSPSVSTAKFIRKTYDGQAPE